MQCYIGSILLGREDRILGAAGLCLKHGLPYREIIDVFHSALSFKASDANGLIFNKDMSLLDDVLNMGVENILTNYCGLDPVKDIKLIEAIVEAKND